MYLEVLIPSLLRNKNWKYTIMYSCWSLDFLVGLIRIFKVQHLNLLRRITFLTLLTKSPGFQKCHPQLTLREPEQTSAARASGFSKISIKNFCYILFEEGPNITTQPIEFSMWMSQD